MAKATALGPDLMSISESPRQQARERAADSETSPPVAKSAPLQIRIPATDIKAIKRAALEADQTISEFMLACFHASMN